MSKLLLLTMFLTSIGCTANVIVKRSIRISPTEKGFEIRLVKHKHRVDRNKKVVIAVIDTGFDTKYEKDVVLCKTGHKSFADDNPISDEHGHGTHIAGLIAKNSKVDYCIIVIKYYSPKAEGKDNLLNTIKSLEWALDQDVDMINYSGGGVESSDLEKALIIEALDRNIVIVAAAGNESRSYRDQTYYPATYDNRIIVVGNIMLNKKGKVVRHPASNYGDRVDLQVFGTNVESVNGQLMTGTSQSTAIVTGRITEYVKSYRVTEFIRKVHNEGKDRYYSPLYKWMK